MKSSSLFQNLKSDESKPVITVLMESDFTKEIRIVFKEGQSMDEHRAPFPIVVEIVEGQIDFGVDGSVHNLQRGDLIALGAKIPHDLKAKQDSIVRLTLSQADLPDRVRQVPTR